VAKYGRTESGASKVLKVTEWVKVVLKNEKTGGILANKKYTVYLLDGTKRTEKTDDQGIVNEKNLPIEDVMIRIHYD
jgi:hypothetical protein